MMRTPTPRTGGGARAAPGAAAAAAANLGGGMAGLSQEQISQALPTLLAWLPKILAVLQRVPAWSFGFIIGLLFWLFIVPLAAPTVLLGDSSGSNSDVAASSWFSSAFAGGSAPVVVDEWDEEAGAAKQSVKSNSNNNAKKANFLVDDEDEDDIATATATSSSQQLLQRESTFSALRRCYSKRGNNLIACMRDTDSLLLHFIVAVALIGFVSDGATEWLRDRADKQAQHERAMDIVEDVFQMERMASLD